MSNKLKNTRVVTFKEDYFSKAGLKNVPSEPIYRKGTTHAIHQNLVAQLKDKGAKMDVQKFDEQAAIKRAKQARDN